MSDSKNNFEKLENKMEDVYSNSDYYAERESDNKKDSKEKYEQIPRIGFDEFGDIFEAQYHIDDEDVVHKDAVHKDVVHKDVVPEDTTEKILKSEITDDNDTESSITDEDELERLRNENKKIIAPPPIKENQETVEKNPFKKLVNWYKNLPPKKKIVVSIISIILAIIIVLTTIFGIFVLKKFSLLGNNIDSSGYDDVIYEEDDFEDIEINIGSAGFKQALIDWATTGNNKKMSSKNVINVLLIGFDSRKGSNVGNTDVMMLLSINKKTKELKIVSFFRDSYLYVEGKNSAYCTKLNAAFSMGGPEVLLQTIENNYKIEIDNYAMVNFESFKAIIDAMGGIQVNVTEAEANYNYKKFKIELPVGENVTLNGTQALCFCRIRGFASDGDVSRTENQRDVIDSMVSRVKEASISDINKFIDVLLPYVETGYSKSQILSLGIKAVTGGWANYERKQLQMPPADCRTSGSANMWIWVVDYQKAAYQLQMEIYGKSNIKIDENDVSIIDVYNGANYTGNKNVITDNNNNKEPQVPDVTVPVVTTTENSNIIVTEPITNEETTPVESETSNNDVSENVQDTPTESDTQQSGDSSDTGSQTNSSSGNSGDSDNSGDSGNSADSGDLGDNSGEVPVGGEGDA